MKRNATVALLALSAATGVMALAQPAAAGSDDGKFGIKLLGTVVNPDTDATVRAGGAVIPGASADVSTEAIPALTLDYYFTRNISAELFCCFAKHSIDGKGTIANLGEIADTWIFPPALTLQYHFTGMGRWQPYVGAGVQYINFFDTGTGQNRLGATEVSIDDAWGFTLQGGIDVGLGNGWSLNFDVKKTWLDTTVTWHNNAALGGVNVVGDADLDPWIFSAGVGYRFNLDGLFGHRAQAAPIK
ncbi:MAG TPA: OmpW family outer membrane protein [Methyloceanibacter sp.]|nr:OmpW family outer membrane protein [Methyloceanibacter sp.]